ncbi:MAG: diguanylate cyclase [Desulfobulbaceae bacterium]|nr:diguanylate cyclase [Desulfobulbaceae bacterium]
MIVTTGDGDCYGEGGNHLMAAMLCKYFANGDTPVTVSIGAASASVPDYKTAAELVWQADKALYFAKRTGKNKTARSD